MAGNRRQISQGSGTLALVTAAAVLLGCPGVGDRIPPRTSPPTTSSPEMAPAPPPPAPPPPSEAEVAIDAGLQAVAHGGHAAAVEQLRRAAEATQDSQRLAGIH